VEFRLIVYVAVATAGLREYSCESGQDDNQSGSL